MPDSGIQLDMFTRILAIYDFPVNVTPHGITDPNGKILFPASLYYHPGPPIIRVVGSPPPKPPTNGLSVIFGAGADDAP